jgi:hypothetical protein
MEPLLDIVKVEARPDHTLWLEFENGEQRIFDMKPYLDRKPFQGLARLPLFLQAKVAFGTVVWPGNLDIAPETLMLRSVPAA